MEVGNFLVKLSSQFDDSGLKKMTTGIKNMATIGLAGATAITGAFIKMVDSTVKQGEELDKLRKITGVSTVELSKLKYAAEQEHTSIESITTGFRKLSNAMYSAIQGNKVAIDTFKEIGVQIQNSDGSMRSQVEVLKDVATAFQKIDDEASKSAIAQDLFGRSGMDLIPFLNMGRVGIEELGNEAEKLGVVMSDNTATRLETFGDSITTLKTAINGIVISVVTEFLPMLEDIVSKVKNNILEGDNWKRSLTLLITFAIEGFNILATSISVVGKALGSLGYFLVNVFNIFSTIGQTKVAVNGLKEDVIKGLQEMSTQAIDSWNKIKDAAQGTQQEIKKGNEEIPPIITDNNKNNSKNNISAIGMAWKNVVNDMLKKGMDWNNVVLSGLSFIENSFKNLLTTMFTVAEEGENKWKSFFDSLTTAFLDLITTILAKMGILALLNVLSGGSAGTLIGLFQGAVKGMAYGGIATSPQLAMVGEAGGEAIIPLSKMSSVMGGDISININGSVDNNNVDEICRKIEKAVRNGQADGLSKAVNERGNKLTGEA